MITPSYLGETIEYSSLHACRSTLEDPTEDLLPRYEALAPCCLLAVRTEDDDLRIGENYCVVVGEGNRAVRVIEKPKHPVTRLKGCGVYVFDLAVFDAVRRTPQTAMRNEYELTSSIQILIDDGHPVYPFERIDWDININTVEDFHACNLAELRRRPESIVYGQNCQIHPGAEITDSVVGHDVVVEHPIRIHRTVVFSGTRIDEPRDLDSVLALPQGLIPVSSRRG